MTEPVAPPVVAFLNPMGGDGWGGVERWLLDLALGFRAGGSRVLAVGRPDSLWTRRAEAAGVETLVTPMRGDLSLTEARRVGRWFRSRGASVVCTKLHKGIRLSGLAARFAGRVPVVAFMGLVEVRPGWRYRWTYRLFLDQVVTLSEAMRREILAVDAGVPPERVVSIPFGVDPDLYDVPPAEAAAARASLGAGEGDLLLVAAGRLSEQKRFDVLLEAFAAIRARVPAARLALVGTGSLREALEAKARDLGVADRTVFAGFRADYAAVTAAADLFVLSSDDEGLPVVVLEAMAVGRAVVATRVGSLEEQVVDGVTGRLVPRRDPAALAAAAGDLLLDGAARAAMAAAGRARVRERFPLSRCVAETGAFLRGLPTRPS